MLRTLRVPEKLFGLGMWLISGLFAVFLIGLGGKIVGDLPGVEQRLSIEQYVDSAALARIRQERDSVRREREDFNAAGQRARLTLRAASAAYRSRRESFENWIATRAVTTDPRQDPAVLSRTRELDQLNASERDAAREVERIDADELRASQRLDELYRQEVDLTEAARGRFERARFKQELRVFAIRLAITLPLLVLAWWLALRKRRSQYWPLARGFVIFAIFAFFVELVPYLPSYGGYVRYGVGVIGTAVAGIYAIRGMRRYLAKRAAVERQTEGDRRRALSYEDGIKRIDQGVCPGCERSIARSAAGQLVNFCVHCGMTLFDECTSCHARKNAFYQYCPACGVATGALAAPAESIV